MSRGAPGSEAAELRALRVRAGAVSLTAFARLYLGHRFTLPWSPVHTTLASDLASLGRTPVRLAVAAPDGYGKSTLLSFALVLWALAYRKSRCIVIASGSRLAAGEHLGGIDAELRRNPLLRGDFPHLRDIARSSGASGSRASPPRVIAVPGIAKVFTAGPSLPCAEMSFEGSPPDLFVFDELDAAHDEAKQGEEPGTRTDRLERTLHKRVLDRFTEASVVVAGPLLEAGGLIDRFLSPKHAKAWTQRFYPAVERYPDDFDRWFAWAEAHRRDPAAGEAFFTHNRDKLLCGASVLWPSHETFERLMRLRAERGWAWFDRYRQGHPPGGSLRTGVSRTVLIGEDDDDRGVSVLDDAGYERELPAVEGRAQVRVQLTVEGSGPRGKPVPGSAPGATEGPVF